MKINPGECLERWITAEITHNEYYNAENVCRDKYAMSHSKKYGKPYAYESGGKWFVTEYIPRSLNIGYGVGSSEDAQDRDN